MKNRTRKYTLSLSFTENTITAKIAHIENERVKREKNRFVTEFIVCIPLFYGNFLSCMLIYHYCNEQQNTTSKVSERAHETFPEGPIAFPFDLWTEHRRICITHSSKHSVTHIHKRIHRHNWVGSRVKVNEQKSESEERWRERERENEQDFVYMRTTYSVHLLLASERSLLILQIACKRTVECFTKAKTKWKHNKYFPVFPSRTWSYG